MKKTFKFFAVTLCLIVLVVSIATSPVLCARNGSKQQAKAEVTAYHTELYSYTTDEQMIDELGGINDYIQNSESKDREVVIAVISSGINTSHEKFKDRLLWEDTNNNGKKDSDEKYIGINVAPGSYATEWTYSGYDFEDEVGKGTQLASLICDLTPKNVKILPIRAVCRHAGTVVAWHNANAFVQLAGFAEKYKDKYNIACSIIETTNDFNESSKGNYISYIQKLRSLNILPIVSAGDGKVDASSKDLSSLDNAVVVSSLSMPDQRVYDDPENSNVWSFDGSASNFGTTIDISAPGVFSGELATISNIYNSSAVSTTISSPGDLKNTLIASARVAAAVAMLRLCPEYYNNGAPIYCVDDVEQRLYNNAIDAGYPGKDELYGNGILNLKNFKTTQDANATLTLKNNEEPLHIPEDDEYIHLTDGQKVSLTINVPDGYTAYYTKNISSFHNMIKYDGTPIKSEKTLKLIIVAYSNEPENGVYKRTNVEVLNFSQEDGNIEDYFTINSSGEITGYVGKFNILEIPKVIKGTTVKAIGNKVFAYSNLRSVIIPDSCEKIKDEAFLGCKSLVNVYAPGVTVVGKKTFHKCISITNVTSTESGEDVVYLPNLEQADSQAFSGNINLIEVCLNNLQTAESNCFSSNELLKTLSLPNATKLASGLIQKNKSLKEFEIGEFVKDISTSTFNLNYLESIKLHKDNKNYYWDEINFALYGVPYNKTVTQLESYNSIGTEPNDIKRGPYKMGADEACLLAVPSRKSIKKMEILNKVKIKGTEYNIKILPCSALFNEMTIEELTIPSSITKIMTQAFLYCNIHTLNFNVEGGIDENGNYLVLGDYVTENSENSGSLIGPFYRVNIGKLNIGKNVKTIYSNTFAQTSVAQVIINSEETKFGTKCFNTELVGKNKEKTTIYLCFDKFAEGSNNIEYAESLINSGIIISNYGKNDVDHHAFTTYIYSNVDLGVPTEGTLIAPFSSGIDAINYELQRNKKPDLGEQFIRYNGTNEFKYLYSRYGEIQPHIVTVNSGTIVDGVEVIGSNIGGTVSYSGSSVWVPNGGALTIDISCNVGYHIKYIRVDGEDVQLKNKHISTYTLSNVNEDKKLEIMFEKYEYSISAVVNGASGSGSITPVSETVNDGESITFTIKPTYNSNNKYFLSSVTVNGEEKYDEDWEKFNYDSTKKCYIWTLYNIKEDINIVVQFKREGYGIEFKLDENINIDADNNGETDYNNAGQYAYILGSAKTNYTISIYTDPGYTFTKFYVNGKNLFEWAKLNWECVSPEDGTGTYYTLNYTFSNINEWQKVEVECGKLKYNVEIIKYQDGNKTGQETINITDVEQRSIITKSPSGYCLDEILINDQKISDELFKDAVNGSFDLTNVTANKTIKIFYTTNGHTVEVVVKDGVGGIVEFPGVDPATLTSGEDQALIGMFVEKSSAIINLKPYASFMVGSISISVDDGNFVSVDLSSDERYNFNENDWEGKFSYNVPNRKTIIYVEFLECKQQLTLSVNDFSCGTIEISRVDYVNDTNKQVSLEDSESINNFKIEDGIYSLPRGAKVYFSVNPLAGSHHINSVTLTLNGKEPVPISPNQQNIYLLEALTYNGIVAVNFEINSYIIYVKSSLDNGTVQAIVNQLDIYDSSKLTEVDVDENPVGVSVEHGSQVEITFAPNFGYYISEIKIVDPNGVEILDLSDLNEGDPKGYIIDKITKAYTFEVSYTIKKYEVKISYDDTQGEITYPEEDVFETLSPEDSEKIRVKVEHGKNLTLSITPNAGYTLKTIKIGEDLVHDKEENPTAIENNGIFEYIIEDIQDIKNVEITFEVIIYEIKLQITADDNDTTFGHVELYKCSIGEDYPESANETYESVTTETIEITHFELVKLKIVCSEGRHISTINIDGLSHDNNLEQGDDSCDNYVDNGIEFKDVLANKEVKISFTKNKYTIKTIANKEGTIAPEYDGDETIHDQEIKFILTPNEGAYLSKLIIGASVLYTATAINGVITESAENDDNVIVVKDAEGEIASYSYTLTVYGHHTVEATFEKHQYTISTFIEGDKNGTITPTEGETANNQHVVEYNNSQNITVKPNEHYQVSQLTINGTKVKNQNGELVKSEDDGNSWIALTFDTEGNNYIFEDGISAIAINSETGEYTFIIGSVKKPYDVNASFESIKYTIEITIQGLGYFAVSGSNYSYASGEIQDKYMGQEGIETSYNFIVSVETSGFRVVFYNETGWQCTKIVVDNNLLGTADLNFATHPDYGWKPDNTTKETTIKALFEINKYDLTFSCGENGTIKISPADDNQRNIWDSNENLMLNSEVEVSFDNGEVVLIAEHGAKFNIVFDAEDKYHVEQIIFDYDSLYSGKVAGIINEKIGANSQGLKCGATIRATFAENRYIVVCEILDNDEASLGGTIQYDGSDVEKFVNVGEGENEVFEFATNKHYYVAYVKVIELAEEYTIEKDNNGNVIGVTCESAKDGKGNEIVVYEKTIGANDLRKDSNYTFEGLKGNYKLSVKFKRFTATITYNITVPEDEDNADDCIVETGSNETVTTDLKVENERVIEFKAGENVTIKFNCPDNFNLKVELIANNVANPNITTEVLKNYEYTIKDLSANTTINVQYSIKTFELKAKVSGDGSEACDVKVGEENIKDVTKRFKYNDNVKVCFDYDSSKYYISSLIIKSDEENPGSLVEVLGLNYEEIVANGFFETSIKANYEIEVEYTIYKTKVIASVVFGSEEIGSISPAGETTLNHGAEQQYIITPNDGHYISYLKIDENEYTISSQDEVESILINSGVLTKGDGNSFIYTFKNDKSENFEFEIIVNFAINEYLIKVINNTNDFGNIGIFDSPSAEIGKDEDTAVYGSSRVIKIKPNSGYRIKTLSCNDQELTEYMGKTDSVIIECNDIAQHKTYIVEFEIITYTVTIQVVGGGSVKYTDKTGVQIVEEGQKTITVSHGDDLTFELAFYEKYEVKSLIVNGEPEEFPERITTGKVISFNDINDNCTIYVEYAVKRYTITINTIGEGGTCGVEISNGPNETTAFYGENATISFNYDLTYYEIKSLVVNEENWLDKIIEDKLTIENITCNYKVNVEFGLKIFNVQVELTGESNGGTFEINPESQNNEYVAKSNIDVTITPDFSNGYFISEIVVKDLKTDGTITTIKNLKSEKVYTYKIKDIKRNYKIIAKIDIQKFNIELEIDENSKGGYLSVEPQKANIKYGTSATIKFNLEDSEKYYLKELTIIKYFMEYDEELGKDVEREEEITIDSLDQLQAYMVNGYILENIQNNYKVIATFDIHIYQIKIQKLGNGTVEIEGDIRVIEHGQSFLLILSPDEDWWVEELKINDEIFEYIPGGLLVENINRDILISVIFKTKVDLLAIIIIGLAVGGLVIGFVMVIIIRNSRRKKYNDRLAHLYKTKTTLKGSNLKIQDFYDEDDE